jgi:hypothetical protein
MAKKFRTYIKEELGLMLEEAKVEAPAIAKKLEDLRKKLVPEMVTKDGPEQTLPIPEKRVQIGTVAKIIDVDLALLTIYLLNEVKTGFSDNPLISFHLGHVYFRSDKEK